MLVFFYVGKKLSIRLIDAYTTYKNFPELSLNYYATLYLKYNDKINTQIMIEKEIIQSAYKKIIQLIHKV